MVCYILNNYGFHTIRMMDHQAVFKVDSSDSSEWKPVAPPVLLSYNWNLLVYRGLFITIHDRGHIATMLNSWPEEDIKVPPLSPHTHIHTATYTYLIANMCSRCRPLWWRTGSASSAWVTWEATVWAFLWESWRSTQPAVAFCHKTVSLCCWTSARTTRCVRAQSCRMEGVMSWCSTLPASHQSLLNSHQTSLQNYWCDLVIESHGWSVLSPK